MKPVALLSIETAQQKVPTTHRRAHGAARHATLNTPATASDAMVENVVSLSSARLPETLPSSIEHSEPGRGGEPNNLHQFASPFPPTGEVPSNNSRKGVRCFRTKAVAAVAALGTLASLIVVPVTMNAASAFELEQRQLNEIRRSLILVADKPR